MRRLLGGLAAVIGLCGCCAAFSFVQKYKVTTNHTPIISPPQKNLVDPLTQENPLARFPMQLVFPNNPNHSKNSGTKIIRQQTNVNPKKGNRN